MEGNAPFQSMQMSIGTVTFVCWLMSNSLANCSEKALFQSNSEDLEKIGYFRNLIWLFFFFSSPNLKSWKSCLCNWLLQMLIYVHSTIWRWFEGDGCVCIGETNIVTIQRRRALGTTWPVSIYRLQQWVWRILWYTKTDSCCLLNIPVYYRKTQITTNQVHYDWYSK